MIFYVIQIIDKQKTINDLFKIPIKIFLYKIARNKIQVIAKYWKLQCFLIENHNLKYLKIII